MRPPLGCLNEKPLMRYAVVQDCYERSLYAICGKPQIMGRPNTVPLGECIALISAPVCPKQTPFPCTNGCQTSFLDCKRRSASLEEKMDRRGLRD